MLLPCFQIYRKVRFNSEMAHQSLQCLGQIASMNGPVFSDDTAETEYLANFLTEFLEFLSR